MNPIALSIGPFRIAWYSIFILFGAILAYIIIIKESKKFGIKSDFVTNLIFWGLCIGILGARIYYVVFNLNYYIAYPSEIIKIWNGGLAIHGGIIAGLITTIIICKKNNISVFKIIDICVPGVIVAQAIGRWGNFFNQEAHGGIVSRQFLESIHLPNFIIEGMYIGDNYYHPTFIYESTFCLIGFIVIILVRRYYKNMRESNIFSIYLVWYGLIRFFIESLRTDSLMLGQIKVAQIISILMIIVGITLFIISLTRFNYYNNDAGKKKKV